MILPSVSVLATLLVALILNVPLVHCEQDKWSLRQLKISPNGAYVLAQDEQSISLLSVEPFARLFRITGGQADEAHFSSDSRSLVILRPDIERRTDRVHVTGQPIRVERWDIKTGSQVRVTTFHLPGCGTLKLTPDGRYLVCLDSSGSLYICDAASSEIVQHMPQLAKPVSHGLLSEYPIEHQDLPPLNLGWSLTEFSPDGRYMVVIPTGFPWCSLFWDMRDMKKIKFRGALRGIKYAGGGPLWSYAFILPDQAVLIGRRHPSDLERDKRDKVKVVSVPSGQVLSRPMLPVGYVSASADPSFVRVRPRDWGGGMRSFEGSAAVHLATGQAIFSQAPALDVYGLLRHRYHRKLGGSTKQI